jgi:hypothetical protein
MKMSCALDSLIKNSPPLRSFFTSIAVADIFIYLLFDYFN